jgi:uncharacterized membrane protein YfcA
VLVYLLDQPEKLAIASSLAIVGLIALAGSFPYLRAHKVHWTSVWLFGLPGMAGTYLGAWGSQFVSGVAQLAVFAVVMIAAAYFMLRPQPVCAAGGSTPAAAPRAPWKIALDGVVVGALTGFVGVGGGFLIVPALVLLGGLAMHQAVATSLVIIAMKSATGFVKYLDVLAAENISLDVNVILLIAGIGIIGSFLGNGIAQRVSQDRLRTLFGGFLIVMGAYILYESVPKLIH